MSHSQDSTPSAASGKSAASRLGASLSLACAVHCLAMPFVITLLPSVGAGLLQNPWVEFLIIGGSYLLASFTLVGDHRKQHGRYEPLLILALALALGAVAHLNDSWEHILMPIAGFTLFGAFVSNWRHGRRHHACNHSH